MSPELTLTTYFLVAFIIGFVSMMYYHAMVSQGKGTDFVPEIIIPFSVLWFVTVPACIVGLTLMGLNWLAKKASFILTPREDK